MRTGISQLTRRNALATEIELLPNYNALNSAYSFVITIV